jgi:hypothetical protein
MKTKVYFIFLMCIVMLSSQKANSQCSGCSDFTSVLTASERKALAIQFAPELRFDDDADTYPNFANDIFEASSNNTDCSSSSQLSQTVSDDYSAESDFSSAKEHIATYYLVQNSGTRYYIDYWWAYYRQPNCISATGGHDYDWEHLVVQVNLVSGTYEKVSVTFFQHSGWYTKTFNSSNMTLVGNHPVTYVGRKSHGNFHKGASCGAVQCCYYGDCRRVTEEKYFDVWSYTSLLSEITCSEAWAAWPGQWGNTGLGPLYKVPNKFSSGYAQATACKGDATTCISSDSQQGCEYSNYAKSVVLSDISASDASKSASSTESNSSVESETSSSSCNCNIEIYPNPVSTVVNINGTDQSSLVKIYNQQGELIKSIKGESQADVSELSKGVYFLQVENGKTIKFIKE